MQLVPTDATFSDHATVEEDDGDPPVVLVVELVVGIYVRQLRLDAKLVEEVEGLVA